MLAGDTLSSVHDGMVSSVMAHYPDPEMAYFPDYPAFRDDLLETLGRARFTGRLKKSVHVDASGGLSLESGISASLIFGAKYVRLPDMQGWVASVAEIDDPWWRAALLRWLHLGARLLTDPKRQPHDEPLDGGDWGESHVVAGACPMPDVDPEPSSRLSSARSARRRSREGCASCFPSAACCGGAMHWMTCSTRSTSTWLAD